MKAYNQLKAKVLPTNKVLVCNVIVGTFKSEINARQFVFCHNMQIRKELGLFIQKNLIEVYKCSAKKG